MKKWILFFLAFALAVIICFSAYLYLYRAEFVSAELSKLYGTPVKVARIRVTSKDIELQALTVYNPTEFAMQPALYVDKVMLKMSPADVVASLFGYSQTIRKICIVDPVVGIEIREGADYNWTKLLANMAAHIENTPYGRLFTVQTISIRDIAIEIRNKAAYKRTRRPPAIHQIVLSADKKSPPQTINSLIYQTTKQALIQIGQKCNEPAFASAIESSPTP